MRRIFRRPLVIGIATALVAAASGGVALAVTNQGPNGFVGLRAAGVGPGPGGFAFAPGGGLGVGGGFGPRGGFAPGGGFGPAARAGGAGPLSADILNPAASYLGISLTTLESALAGGKTLAGEA